MSDFPAAKGHPPEVSWLPCDALQVDPAYQRQATGRASERLIRRIAENWDWRLCAPITVSHREDDDGEMGYFVIDGQHRLRAAEMRGDLPDLPCIISKFDSHEDEAMAFVSINTARKQVTALDKYHARIAAKEDLALRIKAVVEEAGLSVTRHNDASHWNAGEIAFPDQVGVKLQRNRPICIAALRVLKSAYPIPLLRGVELFGGIFGALRQNSWGTATHQRFAEHIGMTRQSNWVERARRVTAQSGCSLDTAMTATLLKEFTKPAEFKSSGQVSPSPTKAEPAIAPAKPEPGERVWCDQCDRRVDRKWVKSCISKFCTAKASA